MEAVFPRENFGNVIHLAAQVGVRYSIEIRTLTRKPT